jgi:hypothetical protein
MKIPNVLLQTAESPLMVSPRVDKSFAVIATLAAGVAGTFLINV